MAANSCSRPCPAYPREAVGPMPVQEAGNILTYTNGTERKELKCGKVYYSDKYRVRIGDKSLCEISADMGLSLETVNGGLIFFENMFSPAPGSELTACYVKIRITGVFLETYYEWDWREKALKEGVLGEEENRFGYNDDLVVHRVEGWTSATGTTYQTAYRIEEEGAPCILYVAIGKGILQLEFPDGETWALVETGSSAGE